MSHMTKTGSADDTDNIKTETICSECLKKDHDNPEDR